MKNSAINSAGAHAAEATRHDRLLAPVAPARPSEDRPRDDLSEVPEASGSGARGASLARHSLTFSTSRFSLDYTYQRMEVLPSGRPQPQASTPPAKPRTPKPKAPPCTKHEVERRAKLAELLTSPHPSRRETKVWEPEPGPASASPRSACRCYVSAARGSTRGDHYFEA